jgi:drug/metabolite transporter (DMT)-like permease
VTAILWALGASLGWGTADYLAGMQARRSPVVVVVLISSAVGVLGIGAIVALRGIGPPEGRELVASLAVGGVGVIGVLAFYRALAIGAMSVVAPIAATSAAVPVLYGVIDGERPALLQWIGMAIAIVGCTLAAREGPARMHARQWRLSLGLAVCAMLAIGVQLVSVDIASAYDPLWTILIARLVVATVFGVAALVTRPAFREGNPRALVTIGAIDAAANVSFAVATTTGLLGIVAVIGSTFPVITVALAHRRLGERLGRGQRAGVVLALAGVVLITARV